MQDFHHHGLMISVLQIRLHSRSRYDVDAAVGPGLAQPPITRVIWLHECGEWQASLEEGWTSTDASNSPLFLNYLQYKKLISLGQLQHTERIQSKNSLLYLHESLFPPDIVHVVQPLVSYYFNSLHSSFTKLTWNLLLSNSRTCSRLSIASWTHTKLYSDQNAGCSQNV